MISGEPLYSLMMPRSIFSSSKRQLPLYVSSSFPPLVEVVFVSWKSLPPPAEEVSSYSLLSYRSIPLIGLLSLFFRTALYMTCPRAQDEYSNPITREMRKIYNDTSMESLFLLKFHFQSSFFFAVL